MKYLYNSDKARVEEAKKAKAELERALPIVKEIFNKPYLQRYINVNVVKAVGEGIKYAIQDIKDFE